MLQCPKLLKRLAKGFKSALYVLLERFDTPVQNHLGNSIDHLSLDSGARSTSHV